MSISVLFFQRWYHEIVSCDACVCVLYAFSTIKQMLCSNEMPEKLSWISWGPLLSHCLMWDHASPTLSHTVGELHTVHAIYSKPVMFPSSRLCSTYPFSVVVGWAVGSWAEQRAHNDVLSYLFFSLNVIVVHYRLHMCQTSWLRVCWIFTFFFTMALFFAVSKEEEPGAQTRQAA